MLGQRLLNLIFQQFSTSKVSFTFTICIWDLRTYCPSQKFLGSQFPPTIWLESIKIWNQFFTFKLAQTGIELHDLWLSEPMPYPHHSNPYQLPFTVMVMKKTSHLIEMWSGRGHIMQILQSDVLGTGDGMVRVFKIICRTRCLGCFQPMLGPKERHFT